MTDQPAAKPPALPDIKGGGGVISIVPQSFADMWRIARMIFASGMAPKGFKNAEGIMLAIMHGAEVGFTPMMALQVIAPINGMPTIYGDGAIALVEGRDVIEDMDEHFEGKAFDDDYTAVCLVQRKGRKRKIRGEFSVADARKAGLWDDRERVPNKWAKAGEPTTKLNDAPWFRHPKRMLKMRARAFALRDGFADILKGLHLREEIEDIGRIVDEAEQMPAATAGAMLDAGEDAPPAPAAIEHQPQETMQVEPVSDPEFAVTEEVEDRGEPEVYSREAETQDDDDFDIPAAPAPAAAVFDPIDPEAFFAALEATLGELTADDEGVGESVSTLEEMIEDKLQEGTLFPPDAEVARKIIAKHKALLNLS